MRKLSFLFLMAAGFGWAQGVATQPNCQYKYRFTNRSGEPTDGVTIISGANPSPWINNTAANCVGWQLQYSSEGFTVVSITLQSATRVYSGVVGGSSPGTVATFSGTDVVGSLPLTSTTGGNYIGYTFYPYIRINPTTLTGTGTVDVTLSGWTSITYAKGLGGSGGTIAGLTATYIPKATSATTIADGLLIDDGIDVTTSGGFNLSSNALELSVLNSPTGTTNGYLAKVIDTSGVLNAVTITTSAADQASALGPVSSGGGTSGNARIVIAGTSPVYFDGPTTAGHIAVPSSTIAGAMHDTGSTSMPANGEVLATVGTTDACASPPCLINRNLFMTPDLVATGSQGNGGGGGGNGGSKQQLFRFTCPAGDPSSSTVLSTGDLKCYSPNGPSTGTIKGWSIYGVAAASATCSATVDVWLAASGVPVAGNKISASAPVTLTTANQAAGGTSAVTTWTKAVAAESNWNLNLATVTGCVFINVAVLYQ